MDRRIPEIARVTTGYQTRKAVENEGLGSHFLLQIRDFDEARETIHADGMIRFTPPSAKREHVLQAGDVLFLSRGQKNFGFAVPELPHPTLASSYFFVLRPEESISGPYLAWYLNQPAAQRHFKRLATSGAHMPVVTRDVLDRLVIPVPDLATQAKIVALDALATAQTKLLAELAGKKRALADAACMHAATK